MRSAMRRRIGECGTRRAGGASAAAAGGGSRASAGGSAPAATAPRGASPAACRNTSSIVMRPPAPLPLTSLARQPVLGEQPAHRWAREAAVAAGGECRRGAAAVPAPEATAPAGVAGNAAMAAGAAAAGTGHCAPAPLPMRPSSVARIHGIVRRLQDLHAGCRCTAPAPRPSPCRSRSRAAARSRCTGVADRLEPAQHLRARALLGLVARHAVRRCVRSCSQ